ncbi:DUF2306 domain-containing protein [Paenibacillus oryzisoli]|uniref:DUF2306 domain-containing protein n=1 Tax=Paenibacillus oryzisoli TaxID=1850517 RepID=UPI003D269A8A
MQKRTRKSLWAFGLLALFAVGVGLYALVVYGNPDHIRESMFVTEKGELPELWYSMLWVHAVSAGLALGIGWVQWIKRLRQRAVNVHRVIGGAYAAGITLAGVTGLYLSYYADGGWIGRTGFAMLSVMWLYTLYRGLQSMIVRRDLQAHGAWMLRNYALTCAAITLRIYMPLAAVLFGLGTNESFVVIAWLAWLPNLLLAERWIRRSRNRNLMRRLQQTRSAMRR